MSDLRRGSTLHRGAGVAEGGDDDFGVRSSKIMFKNCQAESDRLRPPESVTVTKLHVLARNVGWPGLITGLRYTMLQRSYTFDTQISRNSATVLVPASPRFECLNKMRLTFVNPINGVSDSVER